MKLKFKDAKEIIKIPDIDNREEISEEEKILSTRADEINTTVESELKSEIVLALKKTLEKENLTALSAPAIGYNKRIFVIKFNEEIKTFINPIIVKYDGLTLNREKCSSIPGKEFIIPRNTDIKVMYQRANGAIESRQIIGLAAMVFQHEMQHLDGILLSDIGLELDENWDTFTEEEKNEILKMYLESLDMTQKTLEQEIEEDPTLKQTSDAIKFMTSVATGETKLVHEEDLKGTDK